MIEINDLYILYFGIIGIILLLGLMWLSYVKFSFAILISALSPWFTILFSLKSSGVINEDEVGAGSYVRVLMVVIMGIVGFIKFFNYSWRRDFRLPGQFYFFLLFLLTALFSASYSIDPQFTLIRSITFIFFFLFLLGSYSWLSDIGQIEHLFDIFYYIVIFFVVSNVIGLLVFPRIAWYRGIENRFSGLWGQPNTVGMMCMFSYPIVLWKYYDAVPTKKKYFIILLMIIVIFHLISGSRTTLAVSTFGMIILFILKKKKWMVVLMTSLTIIALVSITFYKPASFQRGEGKGITDLTGRDEFWKACTILISEKPLLGYGYSVEGKVWEDPRFYNAKETLWEGSTKSSLHNGYISMIISLGIPIFILWIFILTLPLWKCIKLPLSNYKIILLTSLIMSLIVNFFESVLNTNGSTYAVSFWLNWVVTARILELYVQDSTLFNYNYTTDINRNLLNE